MARLQPGAARGAVLGGQFQHGLLGDLQPLQYYGALRPAEAVGLTSADLKLPRVGWGTALLNRTRPSVGKQWTDSLGHRLGSRRFAALPGAQRQEGGDIAPTGAKG